MHLKRKKSKILGKSNFDLDYVYKPTSTVPTSNRSTNQSDPKNVGHLFRKLELLRNICNGKHRLRISH